jgi:hypothetical protein
MMSFFARDSGNNRKQADRLYVSSSLPPSLPPPPPLSSFAIVGKPSRLSSSISPSLPSLVSYLHHDQLFVGLEGGEHVAGGGAGQGVHDVGHDIVGQGLREGGREGGREGSE